MGISAESPFAGVWDIFGDAGLLDMALIDVAGGEPLSIMVDLRTPDELDFEGRVTVSKPYIEYRAADAPALVRGSTMMIGGVRYAVSKPPRGQGDGVHMVADLEIAK